MRAVLVLCLAGVLAAADPISTAPVNTNVANPANPPIFAESQPFSAQITVQNPYDKAVRVAEMDSTCTCSVLELGSHFLLPHATTTLTVSVDNTNRSDRERLGISLYLTDPALDPIEVVALWEVRAHVAVDSHLHHTDLTTRPPRAFRDVYRYPSKSRPDELHRLNRQIRLLSPAGEVPEGGLRVERIEAPGPLWAVTATPQADGSVVLSAVGRADAEAPEGISDETVIIHTNHPKKPRIELVFTQYIGRDSGQVVFDPDAKRD